MYKKDYLDNGIPIVMESIKGIQSAAMGIWLKVGSRYETSQKNGISHFLEHMFFKGTLNRSQKDISIAIDSVGGELNAFTSRENTAYYAIVLADFIDIAVDVISDIFLNSQFNSEDLKKEKEIVKDEIRMVEDTPDEYVFDLFYKDIWGNNHGLGMPVTGTDKTVDSFNRSDILNHIERHYGNEDIVISCAGKINIKKIYSLLNKQLGSLNRKSTPAIIEKQQFYPGLWVKEKDLLDVHICLGVKSVEVNSPQRYVFLLLNTIFGMGVSSRLFQELRENKGLAYTIHSFLSLYRDTGIFGVYTATGHDNYLEVIETILSEIKKLKGSITDLELTRAKNQLKGYLIMALESSSGRMNNIARQEIYYGNYLSAEQIIAEIEKVTIKEIETIIDTYLTKDKMAITVLGNADIAKLSGII
jgi:predicted Zn-dependent peptidase